MSLKDSNKYLQVKKSELRIQTPFFFQKRERKSLIMSKRWVNFVTSIELRFSGNPKFWEMLGVEVSQPELMSEIMRSFDGESLEILGKSEHIGEFISKYLYRTMPLSHLDIYNSPILLYCLETTTIKI